MKRILDIAQKDLTQIIRNRMTLLFLLIMPIAFTLLFGYAFGGSGNANTDPRLPVGYLDQDNSSLSQGLRTLLAGSTVLRLDEKPGRSSSDLEILVKDGKLAAAVIVPQGYSQSILSGTPLKLIVLADSTNPSTATVENAILASTNRLLDAVRTAQIIAQTTPAPAAFDQALSDALDSWQYPPIQINSSASTAVKEPENQAMSMAHSSPAMMLQFAIAGLLSAATVIVNERRNRSLQRLLTTATSRIQILLGHYMAIFVMIFGQFVLLITFGQVALKVDYLHIPQATLLVAVAAAACVSGLGLLIGILAKSNEQATIFALIPMFVLSGLGGAWVPLEVTGATFQAIGHLSPVAWAMDGFENITSRGLGFNSVLLPALALAGYAFLFFWLAAWRFWRTEEG
ncbi:MAG: ABC transporter permease [Anaerolineales bacterium]|jgi:ABC-2 type transport system permease protein